MSYHQTTGESHYVKVANKFFGIAAKLRYLGMMTTNLYHIQEEIKSRLNFRNVHYHVFQNLSSSHLLCQNIKTQNI
jgi:3-methyladenine DNA glycosylase AlkD